MVRSTIYSSIDRAVLWCFRHWLVLVNGLVLIYGGLPWLSPLLLEAGYPRLAELLFRLYTPLCHQRPSQSFFLFDHQVAFCQRESVMYGALFFGGVIFALVRDRVRPISAALTLLLLLPMAVDGTTHLIDEILPFLNLRSDIDVTGSFNWWMRVISGVLFAVSFVLGVYPRIDRDMRGLAMQQAAPAHVSIDGDNQDAYGKPEAR